MGNNEIETKAERIAKICHQANKAYCESLNDNSQLDWETAPDWQRTSAVNGVHFHLTNDSATDASSHENWMTEKFKEGWKYGPVKDVTKKEHPCMVPFHQLPVEQQVKDRLFKAIVDILK